MKVIHIISSGGFYGAENVVVNLMAQLDHLGCEVELCVFDNRQNPHTEIAASAARCGLKTTVIACSGRGDLSMLGRLHTYLKQETPDVIHTHGYKADIYGYAAGFGVGAAMVSTCHNWTNASSAVRAYGVLDKMVLRYFGQVVAVTPQVADELKRAGIHAGKVAVICNGVWTAAAPASVAVSDGTGGSLYQGSASCPDVENARRACSKRAVIGMVCRLVREKGIYQFVAAAALVLETVPDIEFWIAGDGPERARLEEESLRLGIADKVKILGHVWDMQEFYRSVDIVALPSFREGLPMSLLEAMAAGKAVVASSVGGIVSMVTDGVTGLLVEPGNATVLADSIGRLIRDEKLRTSLGVAGQEFVREHFSASAMASSYLSLYRTVANTSGRKPRTSLSSSPGTLVSTQDKSNTAGTA